MSYNPHSDKVLYQTLHLPRYLHITEREAYRLVHELTPAQRQRFIARYQAAVDQAKREGLVRTPLRADQVFSYHLEC